MDAAHKARQVGVVWGNQLSTGPSIKVNKN